MGSEPMALIEDTSKGEAYFLKKGDKLKDYVVEAVTEESIVLANEESKLNPTLGSKAYFSTSGRIFMSEFTDRQAVESPAKSASETASLDEGSADLSLIERMKARRRKEMGSE